MLSWRHLRLYACIAMMLGVIAVGVTMRVLVGVPDAPYGGGYSESPDPIYRIEVQLLIASHQARISESWQELRAAQQSRDPAAIEQCRSEIRRFEKSRDDLFQLLVRDRPKEK